MMRWVGRLGWDRMGLVGVPCTHMCAGSFLSLSYTYLPLNKQTKPHPRTPQDEDENSSRHRKRNGGSKEGGRLLPAAIRRLFRLPDPKAIGAGACAPAMNV